MKLEGIQGNLKVKDVKDLVLWVLADGVNLKWVMIKVCQNDAKKILEDVSEPSSLSFFLSLSPCRPGRGNFRLSVSWW